MGPEWTNSRQNPGKPEVRRVRLAEWARQEGIARITAYRMLQRGILPVASERSPTGRWYVLVPEEKQGRTVIYARATPGADQTAVINSQIVNLSDWASRSGRPVYMVVREVAVPSIHRLPKLARLLADQHIGEIVVENPDVLGRAVHELLVAALTPQARRITIINDKQRRTTRDSDARAAVVSLCEVILGPQGGADAARRALTPAD